VKLSEAYEVEGTRSRGRGRPKKTWQQLVENDLNKSDTVNRN